MIRHAKNDETDYFADRNHITYLDFCITDKESRVHNISFYKSDLVYSSSQHDDAYFYYVKCESSALCVSAECCHPEVDWDRYDIELSYDENLLIDVLKLAVQHISQMDNRDYIKSVLGGEEYVLAERKKRTEEIKEMHERRRKIFIMQETMLRYFACRMDESKLEKYSDAIRIMPELSFDIVKDDGEINAWRFYLCERRCPREFNRAKDSCGKKNVLCYNVECAFVEDWKRFIFYADVEHISDEFRVEFIGDGVSDEKAYEILTSAIKHLNL